MNDQGHTRRMRRNDTGVGNIGTVARSLRGNAKTKPVEELMVFKMPDSTQINVKVDGVGGTETVLHLTPKAAAELAKGLLMNLPGIYLAADDELQSILSQAVAAAEADAKAVNNMLKERTGR